MHVTTWHGKRRTPHCIGCVHLHIAIGVEQGHRHTLLPNSFAHFHDALHEPKRHACVVLTAMHDRPEEVSWYDYYGAVGVCATTAVLHTRTPWAAHKQSGMQHVPARTSVVW